AVSLGTVLAGLLNFSFLANGGSSGVSNGSNGSPGSNAPPNFFLSFDGIDAYATSGNSVVLWFDDNGSPDDNHDDMAIRISITGNGSGTLSTVPVPAAGFLLFGALGGLAAFKRRRRT
ncbi:MAG: VPLPA-CTERM sorting domain-containing protein, partial [bacterium]